MAVGPAGVDELMVCASSFSDSVPAGAVCVSCAFGCRFIASAATTLPIPARVAPPMMPMAARRVTGCHRLLELGMASPYRWLEPRLCSTLLIASAFERSTELSCTLSSNSSGE